MGRTQQRAAAKPLLTLLEQARVRNPAELAAKPTRDLMADVDRLTIPPSEAVLGAHVLNAVNELDEATRRLDAGKPSLLPLTRTLVALAALTLAAGVVTLIVTIAKQTDFPDTA
jgi:hypothetical protein